MFCAEMKKIWKPGIVVLILMIFVLLFSVFMFRYVKPFLFDAGNDSTAVTLEVCSSFIEKYGNSIEADEFTAIEKEYKQLLYGANTMIAETDLFLENGIDNYEDYFQYMQNAIQGYEGYDYNTYAKMRELMVQASGKSSMYLEIYEDILQQYKSADTGRSSILPFEILAYANAYFVSMLICCLLCTYLLAAPVMVNDRANHMTANQYSSKKGKKIYRIQYLCMSLSVFITVSSIAFVAILVWNAAGTLKYADSEIASFLNFETSVLPLTYGRFLVCFIIVMYVLTFGITNIVFYLSAKSVNAVNMLLKTIPVLIAGCFVGLFMEGLLCESNRIYQIVPIAGCELMVVFVILAVGIFLNVKNYRTLQRSDA